MINLSVAAPTSVDVPLEPEVLLGGRPGVGENRASFGGPDITPLTQDALRNDPELCKYVVRSEYDYYLLAMTLSLAPAPNVEIRNSVLAISLGGERGQAIAWSMSPLKSEGPPVSSKTGGSIDVSLGPMVKIAGEHGTEKAVTDCYLYALGELESDPEWRLQRTSTAALSGLHELTMVVRCTTGDRVAGQVQVSASLVGSRGPFRSRAILSESQSAFACAGAMQ